MLPAAVRALLAHQDGVASRTQLVGLGMLDDAIEVAVRRRLLTRLARGVYVDHTGNPTWRQTVWAACLRHAPAVADPLTTLALAGITGLPARAGVTVGWDRRVTAATDVRVTRSRSFAEHALLDLHPPRLALEHATLHHTATLGDEAAIVALLADAVHSRRTTAERLRAQAARTPRLRGRDLVGAVLDDLADGACSQLERLYVHRVERAHGLPPAVRQARVRVGGRVAFRDEEYLGGLLVVELDGRLGHDTSTERWVDAERDLVTTLRGGRTLRLVWQQVLASCRSAGVVGSLLQAVGWSGEPVPCRSGCTIAPSA